MKGIRIVNLYSHFNYEILFSEDKITIITGPNGFGKSTILRIIHALADSDMNYFFDLDFSELEIVMETQKENFIIKKDGEYLWICGCKFTRQEFLEWKKSSIQRYVDDSADEKKTNDLMESIKEIVFRMQKIAGKVFMIREQRLVKSEMKRTVERANGSRIYEQKIIQTVSEIPDRLRFMMNKTANAYSNVSNELDSTFPQRLFAQEEGISQKEFNMALDSMRKKVIKLQKYGISNIGKLDDIQFKENDARALKVYFADFEKKYLQYENLINCLDLFVNIVNSRFLFKHMQISVKEGLSIQDDNGNVIPLLKLSSGEKEILILFYQMIFEVSKNSMLLIDEPEISFHIAWQRKFAEDLKTIVDMKGFQVVIATHSVQIVNGNRRIQRDLGQQYEQTRLY